MFIEANGDAADGVPLHVQRAKLDLAQHLVGLPWVRGVGIGAFTTRCADASRREHYIEVLVAPEAFDAARKWLPARMDGVEVHPVVSGPIVPHVAQTAPAGLPNIPTSIPVQANLNPQQYAELLARFGAAQASVDRLNANIEAAQRLAAQEAPRATDAALRASYAAQEGVSLVPGLTRAVSSAGAGASDLAAAGQRATTTAQTISGVAGGILAAAALGYAYVRTRKQ